MGTLTPVFVVPEAAAVKDECEAWGASFPTHHIEAGECARCGACERCGRPDDEHERHDIRANWRVLKTVVTCPKVDGARPRVDGA
jgi:hypothetical protein